MSFDKKSRPNPSSSYGPEDFAEGFGVSRETLERLQTYERLLRQWQNVVNLVSAPTLDAIWFRHFADSGQLAAHIPVGAERLADLGSGAGFPGLVLAILTRDSNWQGARPAVTLVESDQRKAAFLREIVRNIHIPVDILSTRIEASDTVERIRGVDVVTARALARLDRLLAFMQPVVDHKSVLLLLKGRAAEDEISQARGAYAFDSETHVSLTDPEARVLVIRHLVSWTEG